MRSLRIALLQPSMIVVLGLAMLLGHQTLALRPGAPVTPTVVATLNLEQVFEKIAIRAEEDARLQALADGYAREIDDRRKEIALMEQDLEAFEPDSKARRDAEKRIQEATINIRALVSFSEQRIEARKAAVLRDIYEQIKASVKQLSTERGYDLVLLDDSVVALRESNETQMLQQISARRILYAGEALDITDELIAWMNSR